MVVPIIRFEPFYSFRKRTLESRRLANSNNLPHLRVTLLNAGNSRTA